MGQVPQNIERHIKQLLENAEFLTIYGFRLEQLGDGTCTLHAPFNSKFMRPDNIMCGPLYVALADAAGWFAIMSRIGIHDTLLTTDIQSSFIKAAIREAITCTARISDIGERRITGVAECTNQNGELLARHSLSFYRKRD